MKKLRFCFNIFKIIKSFKAYLKESMTKSRQSALISRSEVLRLLRVTDVLISSDLLAVLMLLRVKDVVLSSDLLAVLRLLRVKDVLLSSDLLTQHS